MDILIVEDDELLNNLLRDYLKRLDCGSIESCFTWDEAVDLADEREFDCTFIDLQLPDGDGLELLEVLMARNPGLRAVMMSGYPTREGVLNSVRKGASDFLTKPFTFQDLELALERVAKDRRLLAASMGASGASTSGGSGVNAGGIDPAAECRAGAQPCGAGAGSLSRQVHRVLASIVEALETRVGFMTGHSMRVAQYAVGAARKLNLSESQVESIRAMCYLHDIGMVGTADAVLRKTGPLSREEYEHVKQHTVVGDSILADSGFGFSPDERAVVRHHHERWDGTGYPDGLRGEEISVLARIVAVAEAFDAMTTERPFRQAMTWRKAVCELRENGGTQFDPEAAVAFIECVENRETEREHAGEGIPES